MDLRSRKHIFDAVRAMLGRGFTPAEVKALDQAIDAAIAGPMPFDKEAFYKGVRKITGPLDQIQVESIEAVLTCMAGMPLQRVAYVLATAWHEARFKPQPEWGRGKGRRYAKPGARMKAMPNPPTYGGQIPYGRGLVQITWAENYEWLDRAASDAGLIRKGELLANFDLALRPDIAVLALVKGMLDGVFASNGKPLSFYGPRADGSFDYVNARQTVNVLDKAHEIAAHARAFEQALRTGGWK